MFTITYPSKYFYRSSTQGLLQSGSRPTSLMSKPIHQQFQVSLCNTTRAHANRVEMFESEKVGAVHAPVAQHVWLMLDMSSRRMRGWEGRELLESHETAEGLGGRGEALSSCSRAGIKLRHASRPLVHSVAAHGTSRHEGRKLLGAHRHPWHSTPCG